MRCVAAKERLTGLVSLRLAAGLIAIPAVAFAAPPPGADMSLAPWFQSLRQPETGWMCCSVSDCRPVVYRTTARGFQAFIDRKSFGDRAPDDWVDVPDKAILHQHDNPVGEAVACYFGGEIRCFVEASGA